MKDNIKIKGNVKLFEKEIGKRSWRFVSEHENVVTTVGREMMIDLLNSGTVNFPLYFGVGTSAITESVADTGLKTEVEIDTGSQHKLFEGGVGSDLGTSLQWTCILTSVEPTSQPVSLTELGLFDVISGGSLFSRLTYSAYNKTNLNELKFEYTVNII